ncbi:hypothetical protein GLOIN_2v1777513 [Rhizophagus irregularis DAOM 181602=DAOM 197198]|nr:hypothetical protein GLOIN_2v1777513 [Rhizophagus irregularis DAOM 181602=DAOM 197198]
MSDNERFLLTNQDIINFRNSITKDVLNIDIRNSVEKNIHQIFEVNDDEVIKASTHQEICLVLATPEQRKLTWKYGYNGIIHFDRTFGFSNKKVLLFVLLVVNQNNKGIPIRYLLFSAASGVQKASSSYNYAILKELLKQYKDKISIENFFQKLALLEIWPHIYFLLCEFHIIQCWENKIKQVLGSHSGYDIVSYQKDMKEYLYNNIKRSGAIHTATIWINWLRSQLSQNTYYSNLQYNQLPLITLPSQEEALRLLNKDKDQTKELLLFEQKLQDVHRDDNNTLEDNITSNNRDKTATSIETTPLSTETTPLTPLDLNTKHSISI